MMEKASRRMEGAAIQGGACGGDHPLFFCSDTCVRGALYTGT